MESLVELSIWSVPLEDGLRARAHRGLMSRSKWDTLAMSSVCRGSGGGGLQHREQPQVLALHGRVLRRRLDCRA